MLRWSWFLTPYLEVGVLINSSSGLGFGLGLGFKGLGFKGLGQSLELS